MLHVSVRKNKNPDIPAVVQTLWKWQISVYTNCCWPHSRADLWLSALLDMVTWCQRPLWGRSLVPSALWVACWSSPCRSLSSCPTSAESTTRASEPRREERKRWGLHIIHSSINWHKLSSECNGRTAVTWDLDAGHQCFYEELFVSNEFKTLTEINRMWRNSYDVMFINQCGQLSSNPTLNHTTVLWLWKPPACPEAR